VFRRIEHNRAGKRYFVFTKLHRSGAHIIETNTFGANRFKLAPNLDLLKKVQRLNSRGVKLPARACHGWLLHQEAVRCATVRTCSMVSRGDLLRQEGANRIASFNSSFEHADAILGRVMRLWRLLREHPCSSPLGRDLVERHILVDPVSPGSPSTRSAMILRRISSGAAGDPHRWRTQQHLLELAARLFLRIAGEDAPAAPSISIAYIAMSCSIEPATSLPMSFPAPAAHPWTRRDAR